MKKVISAILIATLFIGCTKSVKSITRMQEMEEGVHSPSTVEELEDAIKKYQNRVVDIQMANSKIGIWYKMLGTRYLDQDMYGKALECFQEALKIYPENQNLYYYVGLCAGFMSHTALDYSGTGNNSAKYNYLKLSEEAYQRAIAIEPHYVRALYGLGVLYVFELKSPDLAIPPLELLLTIDKKHIDAMTVLAGAYYATGEYDKAVALYDKIIAESKSDDKKVAAQSNKKTVLERAYAK